MTCWFTCPWPPRTTQTGPSWLCLGSWLGGKGHGVGVGQELPECRSGAFSETRARRPHAFTRGSARRPAQRQPLASWSQPSSPEPPLPGQGQQKHQGSGACGHERGLSAADPGQRVPAGWHRARTPAGGAGWGGPGPPGRAGHVVTQPAAGTRRPGSFVPPAPRAGTGLLLGAPRCWACVDPKSSGAQQPWEALHSCRLSHGCPPGRGLGDTAWRGQRA